MSKQQIISHVLDTAREAVEWKASIEFSDLQKAVVREIYIKQFEEVKEELSAALQSMFVDQLESIAAGLEKMDVSGDKALAPVSDQAQNLVAQVFDPQEWQDDLVDRALPVLAKKMFEAARAQLRLLGFDRKAVRGWRDKQQKIEDK